MTDLYLSLSVVVVCCSAAAYVGTRIAIQTSRQTQYRMQWLVGLLMAIYMSWLWDRPLLTRWLPWSGAIILGNWLPVFACFLAGQCLRTQGVQIWRRLLLGGTAFGLAGYSLVSPLLGQPPLCISQNTNNALQVQTSDCTCSAASAASLLRLYGIRATESEMARLCLTRAGTHWLGVYRGLKLKVASTEWDVVAEEFDVSGDMAAQAFRPGVLSVDFASRLGVQSLAAGMTGASGHSVVLLETTSHGGLKVFDPSPDFGFETWDTRFLQDIRSAVLLRLVPRNAATTLSPDVQQLVVRERQQRRQREFGAL
jgi:hypothetical protein